MTPPRPLHLLTLLLLAGCPKAGPAPLEAVALEDGAARGEASAPGPLLEAAAVDGTVSVRARAVSLLIRYDEAGVDAWSRRALEDDSAWVQRAAIEALQPPVTPELRAALLGLAQDPGADPWVRARAAVAASGTEARKAMSEAWTTASGPWARVPCAFAALELGDELARPALEQDLQTGDLPLDLEFLDELSAHPDPGLARALAAAQPRVESEMELAVAAARIRLGDPAAEQVLRKALADDDDERRMEAIDVLADLEDPVAVSLLRKAVSTGPDFVTSYAELALAGRGLGEASVFEHAAEDPDFELRQFAVRFAARSLASGERRAAKDAERVVLAGLADPSVAVRAEAARASGDLRLKEAEPQLRALLSDDGDGVRVEAAGALLALGG